MHVVWVRFARTGDPNGGEIEWAAYDAARDNFISNWTIRCGPARAGPRQDGISRPVLDGKAG